MKARVLDKAYKNEHDGCVKERILLVIRVSVDKQHIESASQELHRSRDWAYKWYKRHNDEWIEGLRDRHRSGKPSAIPKEKMDKIKQELSNSNTGWDFRQVMDPATNTVVHTIPVGDNPQNIAFNPDNGLLYVTNFSSNTVSVIDPATNTVVGAPIPVGINPTGIAFNPDNGLLYVTNFSSNNVSVINPATNTVVGAPIPVGLSPVGIAFNPNNGLLYVANQDSDTVYVIAPLTTTFSEGCNGTINSGDQTAICTITNTYGRPA